MIYTYHIKEKLYNGFFTIGNENASKRVLIVGSCRCVPYLNYLNVLIKDFGKDWFVCFIDPFDYTWDADGKIQDIQDQLKKCETNQGLLSIIGRTDIFIHEYYQSYGMFNTNESYDKNIYQFGMKPEVDIRIPNWHNKFVLANDIYNNFGIIDKRAIRDFGLRNIDQFVEKTRSSSVPGFADFFENHWRSTRFFGSFNHVTQDFTYAIWSYLNSDILKISGDGEYWDKISSMKFFKPETNMTDVDVEIYGLSWNEKADRFVTSSASQVFDVQYFDEL